MDDDEWWWTVTVMALCLKNVVPHAKNVNAAMAHLTCCQVAGPWVNLFVVSPQKNCEKTARITKKNRNAKHIVFPSWRCFNFAFCIPGLVALWIWKRIAVPKGCQLLYQNHCKQHRIYKNNASYVAARCIRQDRRQTKITFGIWNSRFPTFSEKKAACSKKAARGKVAIS